MIDGIAICVLFITLVIFIIIVNKELESIKQDILDLEERIEKVEAKAEDSLTQLEKKQFDSTKEITLNTKIESLEKDITVLENIVSQPIEVGVSKKDFNNLKNFLSDFIKEINIKFNDIHTELNNLRKMR